MYFDSIHCFVYYFSLFIHDTYKINKTYVNIAKCFKSFTNVCVVTVNSAFIICKSSSLHLNCWTCDSPQSNRVTKCRPT
jgi:hypothetical protein